jgi:hypothetical protein
MICNLFKEKGGRALFSFIKFNILMLFTVILLIGCETKVKTEQEAIRIAKQELASFGFPENVNHMDLKYINVRKNSEIDGWEVYCENSDRTFRLNILVRRDGSSEIHKLETNE